MHVPIGAFLVRGQGRTILVDTGFGPRETGFPHGVTPAAGDPTQPMGEGGDLLAALAKAGTAPEDVDTVFVTHLHSDHVGWLAPEGTPAFRPRPGRPRRGGLAPDGRTARPRRLEPRRAGGGPHGREHRGDPR
ncbi:MBL fold metallo-hydrolase [Amycolatopsis sp. cmx-8-4]|uniref:MBL fold metallo-hydrolase n=1 Tax=Amycolatopsis sp. cmx-8-4 TaxID=2790947 RepID=UPI00397DF1A9